jgi:hypothetical protein
MWAYYIHFKITWYYLPVGTWSNDHLDDDGDDDDNNNNNNNNIIYKGLNGENPTSVQELKKEKACMHGRLPFIANILKSTF